MSFLFVGSDKKLNTMDVSFDLLKNNLPPGTKKVQH